MPAARVAHWISQTLWPDRCPGCGTATPHPDAKWCTPCAMGLAALAGPNYCPTCGSTAHQLVIADGQCPYCHWKQVYHEALVRTGPYQGPLREAIVSFKYRRQRRLNRSLAELVHARLTATDWFGDVQLIVPVPTHWLRRRWRGYHHMGLLTQQLAAMSGKKAVDALRAARRVRPQVGLNWQQRLVNIRGAFEPAGWVKPGLGPVCLVDDVTTTGATLREATRVLAQAGVGPIHAAVLAKAGISGERLSLP